MADSQMEEEGTIRTVKDKKDLRKWRKQGDNSKPKTNWIPKAGSSAKEVDTEMGEAKDNGRLSGEQARCQATDKGENGVNDQ